MNQMLGDGVFIKQLSKIGNDHVMKNNTLLPVSSSAHANGCSNSQQRKAKSIFSTMNKIAKGKLSLGAKILRAGGAEKVFRRVFNVREGEQLLKASQCCLSTTAGPVSGRLFISTDKLAFCSNKAIVKFASPGGELLRFHYKVVIPLNKIKSANQLDKVKKSTQKYLHVTTTDDFEFWFMGFLNFIRTFKILQEAVAENLNKQRSSES